MTAAPASNGDVIEKGRMYMAINLAVERDLTFIFERDDVKESLADHCFGTHGGGDQKPCPHCAMLRVILANAIVEWLALVDQDRASRDGGRVPNNKEAE